MSDYSFMKSGFNNLITNETEDLERNVTILVATYATEGLKHASRYITHHKTRNKITGEDIKRGMMLEVFLFNNRPDLIDKLEEIKTLIAGDDDDDDDDSDEDEDEDEDEEEDELEELEFTENDCECAICKCMNTIYTRWNNFNPTSQLEIIIKENIDKIEI